MLLLALLTVLNLADLNRQATIAPFAYRPLFSYDSVDLRHVAENHGPTAERRFVFYLQLRDVSADDASLTTFPGVDLYRYVEQLYGLGRFQTVEVRDYEHKVPPESVESLRERAAFEGEIATDRGQRLQYMIVSDTGASPSEMVVFRSDDTFLVVDAELLRRGELPDGVPLESRSD